MTPIFIPLTRLHQYLNLIRSEPDLGRRLLCGVAYAIQTVVGTYDVDSLDALLRKRQTVLLLDGIDEVVKEAPWIADGMERLSKLYPKAQIIASSRESGGYVRDLPFSAVKLLPFTDDQRETFVRGWFGADCHDDHAIAIVRHMKSNPELSEIVRNPLLTTVMCVLEEHGVPLPNNEVQLYDERMRLLLGQYDVHKGTVRISSRSRDLLDVAIVLAFHLHRSHTREAPADELRRVLIERLGARIGASAVSRALDELFDPCNVLVANPIDGRLGFGHLRYQEYLVARYIEANRIRLADLAGQEWWRGPFFLLARMATDAEWIIQELSEADDEGLTAWAPILLEARPEAEHKRLREMLRLYVRKYRASARERRWIFEQAVDR